MKRNNNNTPHTVPSDLQSGGAEGAHLQCAVDYKSTCFMPVDNKSTGTLRWMGTCMTMAIAALAFTACSNESDPVAETIELTTPVILLDGVAASTRAAQTLESVADVAGITLYLHDSEARVWNENRTGSYGDSDPSDGISWTADPSVTVTGGEGHYRAGILAGIGLKATADMHAISNAIYAYRGSINVKADGSFTPDGILQPYSSAVLLNLKDADGNIIAPDKYDTADGNEAVGAKQNHEVYLIKPVGLAEMGGFTPGTGEQFFPNGTANPVPITFTYASHPLASYADGNITPGTYPATWKDGGKLVTSADYSQPWPLFEVTYCKDGFELTDAGFVPNGTATTWTVSYPAGKQLTLEPGKLYTFTATLGANAHITLDAGSVSISDWTEGNTINVGR